MSAVNCFFYEARLRLLMRDPKTCCFCKLFLQGFLWLQMGDTVRRKTFFIMYIYIYIYSFIDIIIINFFLFFSRVALLLQIS